MAKFRVRISKHKTTDYQAHNTHYCSMWDSKCRGLRAGGPMPSEPTLFLLLLCRLATLKASQREKGSSQYPSSIFCQTESNRKLEHCTSFLQDGLLARSKQLLPPCNSVHNCGYICIYNCCYRTRTHLRLTQRGDLYLYCT